METESSEENKALVYDIVERIGEGGFGRAYLALDQAKSKYIVIKKDLYRNDGMSEGLCKEREVLSALSTMSLSSTQESNLEINVFY